MGVVAMRSFHRPVPVAYVALVTAVMGWAMADPNHPRRGAFVGALVLCLPSLVAALPVLYVSLAFAWNATGADAGGATWPVTVAYALVAGLVSAGNVWLIGRLRARPRRS
jgi:hypothetical protein